MTRTIEASILEQHALEVAMLWGSRDVAVRDPAYDLDDLAALDERVEANLDGLRLAGARGFQVCEQALADAEAGEIFAATVLALERTDVRALARILDVVGEGAGLERGMISAFGWVAFERLSEILPGLLDPRCPPALHHLGIAGCAAHRRDPGAALGYAVLADHLPLRRRGLRAVGELARWDLAPELRRALRDDDPGCRFWASWSLALGGDGDAVRSLTSLAAAGGPYAARACATAMRRVDPGPARGYLESLARSEPKVALAGAGALGDPAVMPLVLEAMRAPETARAAGAAFTALTGLDLVANKLHGEAPAGISTGPSDDPEDEDVAMDPEENLPWPNPERVRAAWQRRASAFDGGARYTYGQLMTPERLRQVLHQGRQPARRAAAEELAVREPRRPLFEVRAPSAIQRRALAEA